MTLLQSSIVPGGATSGYQISRSLRFNSADSASLSRTPGTAGNQKTATWSGWVKRSALNTSQGLFECYAGPSGLTSFFIDSSNALTAQIYLTGPNYNTVWLSSALFRDVGAWYHIVFVLDTTQASAANYIKVYVNGVQQTMTLTNYGNAIPQNTNTFINSTNVHYIGRKEGANYLNGYATEEYFIDGQALTPSSFGETSTTTGVWNPKAYTGTYGTNGFYINFSDNSNTTAATLGKDYSGNGNNYTPANFSVTAGVNNDSLVDSPTNYGTDTGAGGEVRGDYCTWNSLNTSSGITLSDGNLKVVGAGNSNNQNSQATFSFSSGKWYFENTVTQSGSNQSLWGFINQGTATNVNPGASNGIVCGCIGSAYATMSGSTIANSIGSVTFATNDVAMIAIDIDAGKLWFGKNGTWLGTGSPNPATGTSPNITFTANTAITPVWQGFESLNSGVVNFGQRAFVYTAPSGFKTLVTQNLPTPTVGASSTTLANKYFDATTYTGNGSSQSITNSGSFQPDWVWIKARSTTYYNNLFDVIRGAGGVLFSNTSDAEVTGTTYLTSFNSNGFSVSTGTGAGTNGNGTTFVGWQWKAGGTGVSNTSGSITSTVSANTTAGFSVVTYTGTGANATVGHGLGVAPAMIIAKRRNAVQDWGVYHVSIGNTGALALNLTIATDTSAAYFNNTSPTSSVFSVGTGSAFNASTGTYVAYCFSQVAGFSKFGSYVGNGSADGPFVYCGFRPRYVLIKQTSSSGTNWVVEDAARSPYNVVSALLNPNATNAENTSVNEMDFVSNGFKIRTTDIGYNSSGNTYIYMAFAESPFNYSRAR